MWHSTNEYAAADDVAWELDVDVVDEVDVPVEVTVEVVAVDDVEDACIAVCVLVTLGETPLIVYTLSLFPAPQYSVSEPAHSVLQSVSAF